MLANPIIRLSPDELMEFIKCEELLNRESMNNVKDDHIHCFKNPDEIQVWLFVIKTIEGFQLREKAMMNYNYEKYIKGEVK